MESFRVELVEVLARLDVESYTDRHDALEAERLRTLDRKLHRPVAVAETADEARHNAVVRVHKQGFYWRDRVFRPRRSRYSGIGRGRHHAEATTMGKVIGIDLGTTFSAVAYVNEHGKPEIIPNSESARMTPSVILFEDDVTIVGKTAQQQSAAAPDQIVDFVKRRMGQSVEDFSRTFHGKKYSADELSAIILKKVKQGRGGVSKTGGHRRGHYSASLFRDAERAATRNAGSIAGLNVLQLVNEPTAAAIAYGIDHLRRNQTVFVFDLGGGTFDVTLMEVRDSTFRMLQTNGDHNLGGKDWDDEIALHVARCFKEKYGSDPLADDHAGQELQLNATSAKEVLSQRSKTRIVCHYDGKNTSVELTREEFERLTASKLERCKDLCELVLNDARMAWTDVDTVLLVGGSTRMPMVQRMLSDLTGKVLNPTEVNPDEVVALGAALQGALRQVGDDQGGATRLPPAMAERYGASALSVIDGATHNLGVIVLRDEVQVISVMIDKTEPIPCTKTSNDFSPAQNNQPSVSIRVVEGLADGRAEDAGLKFDDYTIGSLKLELPPGVTVGARIAITFKYNLDQNLEVQAVGPDGRVARITINRGTLNEEAVTEAASAMKRLSVE